ncbi:chaperone protein dnaJ 20, chloroplastic-like [Bidens hawaiensis]|uniref:chaperone protein dnaJ 20, chloroplastic-like n=1 Tax=Bidens hawaiensis TaxID=980011 RepID=UPI00404A8DAA
MTHSKSIALGIQTQFLMTSNSLNTSPRSLSFNLHHKNPLISVRKTPNPQTNATTTRSCYTTSPNETLYDLLDISQSWTLCDIKRAYKKMVLKYHPDVSTPKKVDEYTTRFIQIQEAYKKLSDPKARAMYDCNLAKGLHLTFSVKKESLFGDRPEDMAQWKQSWEVQVEELRQWSTASGQDGRMSWASRVRKQREGSNLDQKQ